MWRREGTDASVKSASRQIHYGSGNGTAEPFGAGATFPSGGTGTSFIVWTPRAAGGALVEAISPSEVSEVLAMRCLAGYLGPTVATAL